MIRYHDLARMFAAVQVTSPPLQRQQARPAPPPPPASSARWGKPSEFSWSNQAALMRGKTGSITVNYPEPKPREFMRIVRADLKIMSELVRVEMPDNPSVWVELDRMTRMAFHFTEFPPKPHAGSPQPSRTTVYDLEFDLHPPPEDEAVVPEETA